MPVITCIHLNLKLSSRKLQSLFQRGQVSNRIGILFFSEEADHFNILLILSCLVYQTNEKLVPRSFIPPSVVRAERAGQSLLGRTERGVEGPWGQAGGARPGLAHVLAACPLPPPGLTQFALHPLSTSAAGQVPFQARVPWVSELG